MQKLSPKASAAKKARDIAAAKTPLRKARKAENQRIGQSPNRDLHHKSDGSVVKVSIKNNRGNFGKGTKTENMKKPFKMKHTDGKKASPTKFFKFGKALKGGLTGGLKGLASGGLVGMGAGMLGGAVMGGMGERDSQFHADLEKNESVKDKVARKREEVADKVVNQEAEEGLA